MNGFDTTILEKHTIPGGLCTSWTRKGYTFDASMHFLMGSREGPFRQLWDELGITPDQEFHYHERTALIEGREHSLDIRTDRNIVEQQMMAISPEDSALIREYLDLYFGEFPMSDMPLDPMEVMGLRRKLKLIITMMSAFRAFDKSTSPEGKTALEVWYNADYAHWKELHQDRARYDQSVGRSVYRNRGDVVGRTSVGPDSLQEVPHAVPHVDREA